MGEKGLSDVSERAAGPAQAADVEESPFDDDAVEPAVPAVVGDGA